MTIKLAGKPLSFHSLIKASKISVLVQHNTNIANRAHQLIAKAIKCPEGYEWERRENPGGYQCGGKGHGTTDTLLAEGKGGLVTLLGKRNWDNPKDFEAVYYPKPGCPGQFLPAVEPFREPAGQ